jgi:type I restriction enzyme S subunit
MKKYDQYKNSGVEWLGEIPNHWEVKKLKHLGNIFPGLNGKKGEDFSKEFLDGVKSFIPFTNIFNNHKISDEQFQYVKVRESENQNRVQKNDILFLMSSETLEDIAKCSIYLGNSEELYLNSFCKGFRISNINVNPEFINYLISSNSYRNYFSLVGRGFTRINIKQEFINDATVVFPSSTQEQSAIVQFLDDKTTKIAEAIAIKQKQIELLKERRQIIIHNVITKGLNKTVKFKDSGAEWIGEIPEHWKFESLKNILTERNEKNAPIRTREILSLSIDKGVTLYAEKTTNLDRFKDDFSQYKLAHKDDLVFNSMNMIVGAVGVSDYFGCVSHVYYTYYGRQNYSNTKFYEYLFKCKTIQGVLYSLGKGLIAIDRGEGKYNTLRLKVSRDDLRSMRLPFPSFSEQNQIISYIETQSSKIDTLISLKEQEIEKLKEYKMSLIDGVVTGKVKVC